MTTNPLELVKQHLAPLPPGPIADPAELNRLLADCWDDLVGDDGAMAAHKLLNRKMENVTWKPPILSFAIERHGAAVLGSTRAELQHWQIDVKKKTKVLFGLGRRQLIPKQKSLDVSPLAEEIATLILDHTEDDRLRWYDDGSVKVLLSNIADLAPRTAFKQTLAGRRRRFREALRERLGAGWKEVGRQVYKKATMPRQKENLR
jgi:hypothetical protein